MKLNAFGDVCLRVLMVLGPRGDELMTSRQIAEAIEIPYNHVIKVVAELSRRGALEVTRGRLGGARITEAGLALSVGSLLRDLDPQQDIVACVDSKGHSCPLLPGCSLRGALARAREVFYAELDPVTVRDLTRTSVPVTIGFGPPTVSSQ